MFELLRKLFRRRSPKHAAEADVQGDPAVPTKRSAGAEALTRDPDQAVGGNIGQDTGYAHETGAEARAEDE